MKMQAEENLGLFLLWNDPSVSLAQNYLLHLAVARLTASLHRRSIGQPQAGFAAGKVLNLL